MADKTGIEWTDATWNPVRGCSRVSEGCRNCYAEKVAYRFSGEGQPYEGLLAKGGQWNGQIKLVEHLLEQPLRWKKPRRIFVNSMSDLFHENVPTDFILKVFMVMRQAKQHTFQVLTKRPERMRRILTEWLPPAEALADMSLNIKPPAPNIWLGVSVEDQKTADERIPLLLQTPAAVRWISAEPLLGEIRLSTCEQSFQYMTAEYNSYLDYLSGLRTIYNNGEKEEFRQYHGLDWVVVGGESGKDARPMHPDWVRSLRDQCVDAGVSFLFKQWGEWLPGERVPDGAHYLSCSDGKIMAGSHTTKRENLGSHRDKYSGQLITLKVGKKKAGRTLDGRTWDEYPNA